jgi:hypothetical protein
MSLYYSIINRIVLLFIALSSLTRFAGTTALHLPVGNRASAIRFGDELPQTYGEEKWASRKATAHQLAFDR